MTDLDHRPAAVRTPARLTSALVATVVSLTAIAPLATDMYVPAFPRVTRGSVRDGDPH